MLPMLLNHLSCTAAKFVVPGKGVWIAKLDVDLDPTGIVPTGRCVLTLGTKIFSGTIDERMSGKFGAKASVQLVGGGNGWDREVPPLHIHNDAGVLSTAVYAATAAVVGEVVVDVTPKPLGVDYVVTKGPASRVLAGAEWYVNELGITTVGPRVPVPFNPLSADILEWDPVQRVATIASDDVVMPGTILLDLRFGTAIVRDVEQEFSKDGARARCWCDLSALPPTPADPPRTPGTRLVQALGAMTREAAGVAYLKRYAYRVAVQGPDGRVTLAIDPADILSGAPPILTAIDVWPGLPGASFKIAPGTKVAVVFREGDPSKPAVVGFAPGSPPALEVTLAAARVALGPVGTFPVLRLTPAVTTWLGALATATGATAPPDIASEITFTD